MEQRPLRLGDIVDDFCPRERRITNHAIVAIVGDSIRQTRCSTCEAEHVFKAGRLPKRRQKDESVIDDAATPVVPAASPSASSPLAAAAGETGTAAGSAETDETPADADRAKDGWLAHRPLIRATLPRTEGEPPPPRPIPEFTMHQRNTRGSHAFRGGGDTWFDRSGGGRNGNTLGNGHPHGSRDQGNTPGQGQHGKRRRHGKRRPPH